MYLVNHGTGRKSLDGFGERLNDGAECIEENGNNDELESAEDVRDLGSGRLDSRQRVHATSSAVHTCAAAAITARNTLIVARRLCWP